jgi:hypothetical protein
LTAIHHCRFICAAKLSKTTPSLPAASELSANTSKQNENCNSFDDDCLIDMSLFHFTEMISRDSRKRANIEREADNNEDSKLIFIPAKLKCRR